MIIDAHHHLWDLQMVRYPWLMAKGEPRFFGDPSPIQRNYLIDEFREEAEAEGVVGSVHIQVGAADGLTEATWIQSVSERVSDWPMAQVVFCDLTAPNVEAQLDAFKNLSSVRGVRQIVGRAPGEDAKTGTNNLLDNSAFLDGLRLAGRKGLSFDLQLIPELMEQTAKVLAGAPDTRVALCHAGSPHDRSAAGLRDWAHQLACLSNLPNVTCKLSGLGMFEHHWTAESIQPIVEIVLDRFGVDRVMFGSNFPVDKLYSSYRAVVAGYRNLVPAEMQQKFFFDTANQFYGLTAKRQV